MTDATNIRVVVAREGDVFVAQCVDYDICTQADDIDTLLSRMTAVINAECEDTEALTGNAFEGISAAPAYYAEAWERSNQSLLSADSHVEFKFAA